MIKRIWDAHEASRDDVPKAVAWMHEVRGGIDAGGTSSG